MIAESFARIFYRNCINVGIPALFCAEAYRIHDGDELRVNVEAGRIENLTQGETYVTEKLPAHILRIMEAGGLFSYLLAQKKGDR